MNDPLEDLDLGASFDELMKDRIIHTFKGRGRRAISLATTGGVVREARYRYLVRDRSLDHQVMEDTCTCQDYLQTGGPCAHIIAVAIATSMNPLFDSYDTECEAWDAYYLQMFGRR